MKKTYTLLALLGTLTSFAQTQIQNGGFELWDNTTTTSIEPQFFNSNKTGTDWAPNGPQTCFRDASVFHSGTYSVRIETQSFVFAVVNGSVTTGIVNAPTTSKTDGYIGTMKGTSTADIRRMSFTGRPDSLIGFYRYTQGGPAEKAKVVAYLHVGNYYDPQAASSYHPDSSANKIATALFVSSASNISNWTRFAVAFNYLDTRTPQFIMISVTSSNDQLTSVAGSKLWLDDLSVVYAFNDVDELQKEKVEVYTSENSLFIRMPQTSLSNSILNIYDLTGKIVYSRSLFSDISTSINLFQLNKGLYLYQITGKEIQKTGKFFIE